MLPTPGLAPGAVLQCQLYGRLGDRSCSPLAISPRGRQMLGCAGHNYSQIEIGRPQAVSTQTFVDEAPLGPMMSLSADSATAMFSSEKRTGLRMKGQKLGRPAIHGKRLTVESSSRRLRDDRLKPASYAWCLAFAVSHFGRAGCDQLASTLH